MIKLRIQYLYTDKLGCQFPPGKDAGRWPAFLPKKLFPNRQPRCVDILLVKTSHLVSQQMGLWKRLKYVNLTYRGNSFQWRLAGSHFLILFIFVNDIQSSFVNMIYFLISLSTTNIHINWQYPNCDQQMLKATFFFFQNHIYESRGVPISFSLLNRNL